MQKVINSEVFGSILMMVVFELSQTYTLSWFVCLREVLMPIYEYKCGDCEHEFEELVRSSKSEAGVKCPKCSSKKVERKISTFAAHEASASMPAGGGCAGCPNPSEGCPYSG